VFADFAAKRPRLASTAMESTATHTPNGRLFVVERFVSGLDERRLEELVRHERQVVTDLRWSGLDVVYAGSIAIPQDETCLCFFRGADVRSVARANLSVSLASDRILEAFPAGPAFLPRHRTPVRARRKEHHHEATHAVLGHRAAGL
jgi:hypothetical protein